MIILQEASASQDVSMPRVVAQELVSLGIAGVAPTDNEGVWRVSGVQKVGSLRVADNEVQIVPKLPIERLFFLLGFARDESFWRDEIVELGSDRGLLPAIAHAFIWHMRNATSGGVLQGYRTVQSAEPAVRGRVDFAAQLKRRYGMPVPVEVVFDDFTINIDENRMLLSAIDRLLRLPQLGKGSRRSLRHHLGLFIGVSVIPRGAQVPTVRFDRRNAHYRSALKLADLILSSASLEQQRGEVTGTGFLLNLSTVFEQFVSKTLGDSLGSVGGQLVTHRTMNLDVNHRLKVAPDMTWVGGGRVLAVADAKYKVEKPSGYPVPDIYQMLAYCTRLGLRHGHLVYAAGEVQPIAHRIEGADITVHCHAVDLDGTPDEVLSRIGVIATRVADSSAQEQGNRWEYAS